jgi:hypothetical protein
VDYIYIYIYIIYIYIYIYYIKSLLVVNAVLFKSLHEMPERQNNHESIQHEHPLKKVSLCQIYQHYSSTSNRQYKSYGDIRKWRHPAVFIGLRMSVTASPKLEEI